MMMQPNSTAGMIEWLSADDWRRDVIIAVPEVARQVFTFVFTPFLSDLESVDMLTMDVFIYDNQSTSGGLSGSETLPVHIDEQALAELYLAMIESLNDELEGDYVLMLSPEDTGTVGICSAKPVPV